MLHAVLPLLMLVAVPEQTTSIINCEAQRLSTRSLEEKALSRMPHLQSDLNPIENAFAKLRAKRKAERTIAALWDTVGTVLDLFTGRTRKLLQGCRI